MSSLSDILGDGKSALQVGGNSITAAAQAAASGDIMGAIGILQNTPGDMINSIGSGGGTDYGDTGRAINARGDAVQNWCWYCIMPSLTDGNAISLFSMKPSVALPWYYVQKMNLPLRSFQVESISRNGYQAHYPESYSVNDLQLEFFLDSKGKAQQYLKAWQGLILNSSDPTVVANQGLWGLPSTFKKPVNLVVLSVDKKILLNVKYINCWPKLPQDIDLNSEAASAVPLTVQFAVEDVNVVVQSDKGLIDTLKDTAQGYAMSGITNFAQSLL